jgi:hypothetical protein
VKNKLLIRSLFCSSIALAACIAVKHGLLAGLVTHLAISMLLPVSMADQLRSCFANNFGVLNNSIIIQDALDDLMYNITPLTNLVVDVTDQAGGRYAKPGETITVKDWSADFTAYQVGSSGYVAPDYTAKADKQVVLSNTPTAVSFYLNANEYRLLASGAQKGDGYNTFLSKIQGKMSEGLGRQMVADYHAMIDAHVAAGGYSLPAAGQAYASNTVSPAGTFGRATEIQIDSALFSRRVSRIAPNAILPVSTFAEWAQDHVIIQNYTGDVQTARLMDAGVKSIISNETFWRTQVPMPASCPRGYAQTKTAALFVSRIPDEPSTGEADPVSLSEVVNPQTKIAVLARLWKNAQTGRIQMDIALLYTFAPGQDEAMQRITLV